jgi:hypothetical protein
MIVFPSKERKKIFGEGLFYLFQKNKHISYDHVLRRERNIHA